MSERSLGSVYRNVKERAVNVLSPRVSRLALRVGLSSILAFSAMPGASTAFAQDAQKFILKVDPVSSS